MAGLLTAKRYNVNNNNNERITFENNRSAEFGNIDENSELIYSTDKKVIDHDNFMDWDEKKNLSTNTDEVILQASFHLRFNDISVNENTNGNYVRETENKNDDLRKNNCNFEDNCSVTTTQKPNEISMEIDVSWIEDFELRLSEESDHELTRNQSNSLMVDNDINTRNTTNNDKTECQKDATLPNSKLGESNDSIRERSVKSKIEGNVVTKTIRTIRKKARRRSTQKQSTLIDYSYKLSDSADKIQEHASNTKVNVPILISQLMRAKVVLERLPESLVKQKLHNNPYVTDKFNTVTYIHYCRNCAATIDNATAVITENKCQSCRTLLQLMCAKCNAIFTSFRHGIYHMDNCYQIGKRHLYFDCVACDYKTDFRANLMRHVTSYHPEFLMDERYECIQCQKRYRKYKIYLKHIKSCHVER